MRNTTKVGSCCGHDCTPLSGLFGVTCAGTSPLEHEPCQISKPPEKSCFDGRKKSGNPHRIKGLAEKSECRSNWNIPNLGCRQSCERYDFVAKSRYIGGDVT